MTAALSVRNLRTHFFTKEGVAKAVDGVDFDVAPGEILGLVGESGSGKTVTGFSILGLIDPPGRIVDGSSIRFNGEELTTALADVLKGRSYLTPLIAKEALAALAAPPKSLADRLTPRQREVLRLTVQGRSMKEIAAEMDLSPRTVETHKYEMMHALQIQTTAELIRFAFRSGLVSAQDGGGVGVTAAPAMAFV